MSTSPTMKDLFAAARDDAPSSAVRDVVWERVAAATVAPAGAAVAAKAAAAPAGAKLLAIGAVIGAAGAVLTALAVTSIVDEPPAKTASARREPAAFAPAHEGGARLADPAPRGRAAPAQRAVTASSSLDEMRGAATAHEDTSSLAEEARLVTEARAALVRGEPERALALARSTHRLAVRALEPEELGLEARALRALGRIDEALAMELTLRGRFPTHALAR